jgi:CRP/FNR family cyclic AMP-dependent transcriptional regulator
MVNFPYSPWLEALPTDERDALLNAASILDLGQGEFVYRQGDVIQSQSPAFFGVASGLLKMSVLDFRGKEAVLAVIEPGNWVGEVAILSKAPREQSTTALTASKVFAVNAASFMKLMKRGAFAEGMATLLAGRLRRIQGIRGDLALLGLRERVARRLVMLVHGDFLHPSSCSGSVTISQEILALLLGISRVTLSKELHALVAVGAIALHYGRIEITNMELLITIGDGNRPVKS